MYTRYFSNKLTFGESAAVREKQKGAVSLGLMDVLIMRPRRSRSPLSARLRPSTLHLERPASCPPHFRITPRKTFKGRPDESESSRRRRALCCAIVSQMARFVSNEAPATRYFSFDSRFIDGADRGALRLLSKLSEP